MRFAFTLLALAGVTSASIVARQSLPSCAAPCIANADIGNCDPQDNSCLCHNSAFVQSVTNCITTSCTGSDLTNAEAVAQSLCSSVGVTLTAVPSTSGGSAAPSSTAPAPQTKSSAPSAPPAASSSSPTPTPTSNGALSHSANAFAGVVAVGVVALAL